MQKISSKILVLFLVTFALCLMPLFGSKANASDKVIKELNITYDESTLLLNKNYTYEDFENALKNLTEPKSEDVSENGYYIDSLNTCLVYRVKDKQYWSMHNYSQSYKTEYINSELEYGIVYTLYIYTRGGFGFENDQIPTIKINGKRVDSFLEEPIYKENINRLSFTIPFEYMDDKQVEKIKEEQLKVSQVNFDNFILPTNGQKYASNIKLSSDFPGKVTRYSFTMFNRSLNDTEASAGDNVAFCVYVKLNDGYKWADSKSAYLNGKKQEQIVHNDTMGTEYGFVWKFTIGYTDKIKITDQSPETVEYANGEDVKLFVKATGAGSYQWALFELGSVVKQTYIPKKIAGATKSEYTITKADSSLDGKQYRCTLTSDDGIIYSNTFTLKLVEKKAEEPTKTEDPAKTEQPTTQQPEKVVTYEVDFETNGGNKISTIEVKTGEKVTKPTDPKKDGYTFEGWYLDSKLTKEFDFNKAIDDDIILYAKWSEAKKEEQPTTKPTEKPWKKASSWAEEELDKANALNVIPEIFNKQDLTQNITRKEFAHVAVKLYEKLTGKKATAITKNPFTDTTDVEVLKAYNVGITLGTSDTTFTPDALITREQMATMMTRALTKAGIDTKVDLEKATKFADDAEMHDWGKESIYYMSSIEIIKGVGDNLFDNKGNATREAAILISIRSAEKFAK